MADYGQGDKMQTVDQGGFSARAAILDRETFGCERLMVERAVELIRKKEGLVWLDIVAKGDGPAREKLEDQLGFHELAVEDALSSEERPTLQDFEDHLFFVVAAVVRQEREERFVEVAFFLTEHALVTVAHEPLDVIEKWFERWVHRPKQAGTGPAELAHTVVDAIIDDYFPVADAIEDEVDEIGDAVFSGQTDQVGRILVTKRRLLRMRRHLSPARDVLNAILRRDLPAMPDRMAPYFQDVLDHVLRLAESVDSNRDALASMLDVHLSTISNNINFVLRRMTVLSIMAMGSTLVAGIYGMNFDFMPELHWRYGYLYALVMSFIVAPGVIYICFKRWRWI